MEEIKRIDIKGQLASHEIVKQVVNIFIEVEHLKKGKGAIFPYHVEDLPNDKLLITRPGHKKNFDFKVEVAKHHNLGKGSYVEIAKDLRDKKEENPQGFSDLLKAIKEIYHCTENCVDTLLKKYPNIEKSFSIGAKVEVILKVIKWLFILEDIIYWNNEGRAFLYNYLIYFTEETDENRLKKALETIKNPEKLKNFMEKCNIKWTPIKG